MLGPIDQDISDDPVKEPGKLRGLFWMTFGHCGTWSLKEKLGHKLW